MDKTAVTLPTNALDRFSRFGNLLIEVGKIAQELGQLRVVPKNQAWFWSKEWQAGEREVEDALARGEYQDFEDVEKLIAQLHHVL